jgi:hypothetical protein
MAPPRLRGRCSSLDVFGDGVSVAARLEGMAEPGTGDRHGRLIFEVGCAKERGRLVISAFCDCRFTIAVLDASKIDHPDRPKTTEGHHASHNIDDIGPDQRREDEDQRAACTPRCRSRKDRRSVDRGMALDLSDEERLALVTLLTRNIADDRRQSSARVRSLKLVLSKLDKPGKPTVRNPTIHRYTRIVRWEYIMVPLKSLSARCADDTTLASAPRQPIISLDKLKIVRW